MGNSLSFAFFRKRTKPLPVETMFKLPSPIPAWPAGDGFASGTIDLGGLEVQQVSTFDKVWAAHEGGPDNLGASFYEPSSLPEGFFMLGSFAQPNNNALLGWVLVGRDLKDDQESVLSLPVDYSLVWSSENLKIKQDGNGYIWQPKPADGYKAVGYVITNTPEKPSLDKIRCVRSDLTESVEVGAWVWGQQKEIDQSGFNVHWSRPVNRGPQAWGVPIGSFLVQKGGDGVSVSCLKNAKNDLSAMPNFSQVQALIDAYSPKVYLHPDEKYLPSTVNWYFQNGALLFKKGEESNPVAIEPDGSNLPQDGSNDGTYWLDLPINESEKERVKKGNLQDAGAYFHIKPMLGASFTDIAIWVFYPFNGPSRAKVEFFNVSLGKIGEHVGDWEHLTLRISNFNGELTSMYFSEHSGGSWVNASELEFDNGNKPVAYASLNGHAHYSKPGLVLQGTNAIGIRNDTAKSKMVLDTGVRSTVVAAEYLGSTVVEPPWLNYTRKWGPKISYNIQDEIKKVEKLLPGRLKRSFEKFVNGLPNEILGEEGPTGPKVKNNWNGDEKV